MAEYKVPQDVEADDKLIGPFSFRQFIYLIIVALAGGLAWFLWTLLPPLVVIPLPVILFFGALALPLRKDQPMEIYLAAILSYYLKPRRRLWQPDGRDNLVEISVPKITETNLTKSFQGSEAAQRLGYLANLSDSRGWSVRGVSGPQPLNTAMTADAYNEAQQAVDVLDETNTVSQNLDRMIQQTDAQHHQALVDRVRQSSVTPASNAAQPSLPQPATPATPVYNPYPTNMNQTVLQPLSTQPASGAAQPSAPATTTPQPTNPPEPSKPQVNPDIINLANNHQDLSIETLAREANRITKKEADLGSEEVVIPLR